MQKLLFIFLFVLFSCLQLYAQRQAISLTSGWKFYPGANENAASINCDETDWQTVTIPHDWAIAGPFDPKGDSNTGKLPWKGEGWYRYAWSMPVAMQDKRIILLFDGVMAFPKVYVNEKLAGKWDYGYNSFYVDITDYLNEKEKNIIAVHVDTREHDSRWYPGAGIYRKVQLIAVNPIHVHVWGTEVITPILKSNYAKVNCITSVRNQSNAAADIEIEQNIYSPNGNKITSNTLKGTLSANTTKDFEATVTLNHPHRWEIGHGSLYVLKTTIRKGNEVLDVYETPFGIRSIRFTPDDGFYLNDHRVQLKGVCLHHDLGMLGAAFDEYTMEQRLIQLKEMGCNAIRTSHNCPAPELLELCDKMGMLVIDEIFDKYDRKADIMDTTDFHAFAQRNVKNFVLRDRNHPSIILWSVGNEIGDVQWNKDGGFDKLRAMVNAVRQYDMTRPVTLVCDSRNSASLRHFDYYDVHSWNYGRRYDLARQLEPNKAVIISESASTVSTRGFYEFPLPMKKIDFTKSLQVSSYDLNAPEWAEIPDDDFMWQQEENYVAGEFVWTGFDYLGEPTPYDPWGIKKIGLSDSLTSVSSYFGIIDLVGLPKDRYYLYKSYWNDQDTTIHILPHWNWKGHEGDTIPVFVYTNGDCAELFLNGKSLGMQCKKPDSSVSTERFRLMWKKVKYEPGELKVIAYKEGVVLGSEIVKTAGEPYQLKLTSDRKSVSAGQPSLTYLTIEALDKNGILCPLADNLISFEINGPGIIYRTWNGNAQSTASFASKEVKLFFGKAVAILQANGEQGIINVTAISPRLKEAAISLSSESSVNVK